MDVRGVDFSGSKRPGRDVWLADGGFDGGEEFEIVEGMSLED